MKMLKQALNLLNASYYILTFNIPCHMRGFDWYHTYQDVTGLRDTCQRANMLCVFCFAFKLVRHWALWKSEA